MKSINHAPSLIIIKLDIELSSMIYLFLDSLRCFFISSTENWSVPNKIIIPMYSWQKQKKRLILALTYLRPEKKNTSYLHGNYDQTYISFTVIN